jgi:arabinose operon protein AraL
MMSQSLKGWIIDLDGTVYRGKQVIDGAAETIAYLKLIGMKLVFLSNRGNISRKMCHDKLLDMGLDLSEEEILLSSTVTARYLQKREPGCSVWVLGDKGLADELQVAGLALARTPEKADWLVITLHETVTYRDLNQAFRAVRHGAKIIATNADKTFPGDDGDCIDVAGMIGAIVSSTGQEVEIVIGKPSAIMAEAALDVLGLPPEECVMVGDSLESDIALGRNAGIRTALVLSGSTEREQLEAFDFSIDYVWDSLADARMLF